MTIDARAGETQSLHDAQLSSKFAAWSDSIEEYDAWLDSLPFPEEQFAPLADDPVPFDEPSWADAPSVDLPTDQAPTAEHAPGGGSIGPESGSSGTASPLAELSTLVSRLEALAGTDWHAVRGQGAHDALDLVEQADRRLAATRASILSAVEADGLWTLDGQRTFATWLRDRAATTRAAAGIQSRRSRALRDHFPLSHAALQEGRIGLRHVDALVNEGIRTHRLQRQLRETHLGEEFLVEKAALLNADEFTRLIKEWAIAVDPDAADRAWQEDDAREELSIAPTTGGFHVNGWLDELSGQVVTTALSAHMGTKDADDRRTPNQRRASALVSLAHQSLDAGVQLSHARVRPHVTVTVSLETLAALAAATGSVVPPEVPAFDLNGTPVLQPDVPTRDTFGTPTHGPVAPGGSTLGTGSPGGSTLGTGSPGGSTFDTRVVPRVVEDLNGMSEETRRWIQSWVPGDDHVISTAIDPGRMAGVEPATLEDGTPIPHALLARMACDSSLSRVIFGPESTVLDVGREKRIFPANMTRAIVARDRHCQFPRCDEPPGFGEIHHSLQWYRDHGPTSVEHGILLCWHHHDLVHARGITIARTGGRWTFYSPGGNMIDPDAPPRPTTERALDPPPPEVTAPPPPRDPPVDDPLPLLE